MSSVLEVRGEDWEKEVLKHDTLVVVDFWHEQCVWCVRLDPVYAEASMEYGKRVRFAKLNVFESDTNRQIAINYGIMSTPTLVFFCEGRPIGAAMGFQTKDQLKKLVDDMIQKHPQCVKQSTKIKG